jgi:hypothetical protein
MNKSYLEFLCDSLCNLTPGAQWKIDGKDYSGIVWLEKPVSKGGQEKPTEEEVQAEVERLQAEYEYNQYQRNRATSYPSIQDQLDVLYHQGYDGWKESINKVKEEYPKPE